MAWPPPCALGLPRAAELPDNGGPKCGPQIAASTPIPCGLRVRPAQLTRLACTCGKAGSVWKKPRTPCWRLPRPRGPRVPLASPGPRWLPTARPGAADARRLEMLWPQQAWPHLHHNLAWPRCPQLGLLSQRLAWAGCERAQHKEISGGAALASGRQLSVAVPSSPPAPQLPCLEAVAAPERTPPGVERPEGLGEWWSWPQSWRPSWKAGRGKRAETRQCLRLPSGTRHFTVRDERPAPGLGLGRQAPARQPCQENAFFSLPLPLLPRGGFRSLNALRTRRGDKKGNLWGSSFPPVWSLLDAGVPQTSAKLYPSYP